MKLRLMQEPRLGAADMALLTIFFIGIYLGVAIQVTATVPFPAAPAGLAGVVLLWRQRDHIKPPHLACLFVVVLLYMGASFSAPNLDYLGKRFTGLIQLTYSLVIAYAMFLALLQASRSQLSSLFMTFVLVILAGCLLETYAGLDALSNAVRKVIYSTGVYDADLRDQVLYGKVRPKLFTSEPSAVTFGYTLFLYAWFVVSTAQSKPLVYLGLIGAGILVMPGPTLLLGLLFLVPYYLFVLPVTPPIGRFGFSYKFAMLLVGGLVLLIFGALGATVYAERVQHILSGNDPSFFYRVIGPALVGIEVMSQHPWAGIGLTSENFITDLVMNVFVQSQHFSAGWRVGKISEVLTNYFWLHWIYLGIVWGGAILVALSVWLRALHAPSILYCWSIWIIFGQASGSYVGPKTWVVFLLAAALSMLHQRVSVTRAAWQPPVELPARHAGLRQPALRGGL